jgi:lipid A 3-O-deacylase
MLMFAMHYSKFVLTLSIWRDHGTGIGGDASPERRNLPLLLAGMCLIGSACGADDVANFAAVYAAPDSTADLPAPSDEIPSRLSGLNHYELRFGAFAHGVASAEQHTFDLNPELVLPILPFGQSGSWRLLIPRPHLGALINLEGRTSSVYAGGLWTIPLHDRFFGELFLDGAAHNGYTAVPPPGHSDLGCAFLFHAGVSSGYHFNSHWSLMLTFDHQSNGHSIFGVVCDGRGSKTHNQGINDYGTRIGYSF